MTTHMTGTREKWIARLELLKAEKEFTRRSAELVRAVWTDGRMMALPR